MDVAEHVDVMYGADKLVDLNVESGDEVLIITSPDQATSIPQALAGAVRAAEGCTATTTIYSGHTTAPTPEPVISAASTADVVFMATKAGTGYSTVVDSGLENGGKVVLCFLQPEQFHRGAITGDYESVRSRAKQIESVLSEGEHVRVTTDRGTDVTLELRDDRNVLLITGIASEADNGNFTGALAGEAHVAPDKTSVNGTIVVDVSSPAIDEYGEKVIGRVDEPIELTVEDGEVVDISGGNDADRLESILETAVSNGDTDANMIAEFGLGANPDARFLGSGAEDKKRLGTAHFAVGDNQFAGEGSRFAGDLHSNVHVDNLVDAVTVEVEGEKIMDEGELLL